MSTPKRVAPKRPPSSAEKAWSKLKDDEGRTFYFNEISDQLGVWTEFEDDGGIPYWYNAKTNELVWTKPGRAKEAAKKLRDQPALVPRGGENKEEITTKKKGNERKGSAKRASEKKDESVKKESEKREAASSKKGNFPVEGEGSGSSERAATTAAETTKKANVRTEPEKKAKEPTPTTRSDDRLGFMSRLTTMMTTMKMKKMTCRFSF